MPTRLKFFQGAQAVVVVQDPALLRRYASRAVNRHPVPYLERGEEEVFNSMFILFSRDAWWRTLRSAWQPFFNANSLHGFGGERWDAAAQSRHTCYPDF
jgi:hypothetical protein